MTFLRNLAKRFNIFFRNHYENRISLPYGISQFIGNVALIQLGPEEYVSLNNPYGTIEVELTTSGARPRLNYKWYDAQTDSWKPVTCIIEIRGFNVSDDGQEWSIVDITDKRISPLKDMFLASAFYFFLRPEQKRKRA